MHVSWTDPGARSKPERIAIACGRQVHLTKPIPAFFALRMRWLVLDARASRTLLTREL